MVSGANDAGRSSNAKTENRPLDLFSNIKVIGDLEVQFQRRGGWWCAKAKELGDNLPICQP